MYRNVSLDFVYVWVCLHFQMMKFHTRAIIISFWSKNLFVQHCAEILATTVTQWVNNLCLLFRFTVYVFIHICVCICYSVFSKCVRIRLWVSDSYKTKSHYSVNISIMRTCCQAKLSVKQIFRIFYIATKKGWICLAFSVFLLLLFNSIQQFHIKVI